MRRSVNISGWRCRPAYRQQVLQFGRVRQHDFRDMDQRGAVVQVFDLQWMLFEPGDLTGLHSEDRGQSRPKTFRQ
nr:MAG TPA: hypothetical protein [Caudoviricetes sp.]